MEVIRVSSVIQTSGVLARMPVCKAEAHRALELLEDYYARLDEAEEKELKVAIERVIKIFKSRLFQALLDIQVRR